MVPEDAISRPTDRRWTLRRAALALAVVSALAMPRDARALELDLAKHELAQIEMAVPKDHAWEYSRVVEHRLRFDGVDGEIPLSCSVSLRSFAGSKPDEGGFDPSTLKLAWLEQGTLVRVTWETFTLGQGRYSQEGDLVLLFDGKQFHELFRDVIFAYGRSGMDDSSANGLDFSYDRASKTLTLTRTGTDRWPREKKGPGDKQGAFEKEERRDDGVTVYLGEGTSRRVWNYRLAERHLEFVAGERYAELEGNAHPVEAVATAFHVPVARLRRLNATLARRSVVSGPVRIDDKLGPYAPEREDRISGPSCR